MGGAVCGTDGKTYSPPCTLDLKNCREETDIGVAFHGECETAIGGGADDCPESCTMEFNFVCGTDGTTYVNRCILNKINCERKTNIDELMYADGADDIEVAHDGECLGDPMLAKLKALAERRTGG